MSVRNKYSRNATVVKIALLYEKVVFECFAEVFEGIFFFFFRYIRKSGKLMLGEKVFIFTVAYTVYRKTYTTTYTT